MECNAGYRGIYQNDTLNSGRFGHPSSLSIEGRYTTLLATTSAFKSKFCSYDITSPFLTSKHQVKLSTEILSACTRKDNFSTKSHDINVYWREKPGTTLLGAIDNDSIDCYTLCQRLHISVSTKTVTRSPVPP